MTAGVLASKETDQSVSLSNQVMKQLCRTSKRKGRNTGFLRTDKLQYVKAIYSAMADSPTTETLTSEDIRKSTVYIKNCTLINHRGVRRFVLNGGDHRKITMTELGKNYHGRLFIEGKLTRL